MDNMQVLNEALARLETFKNDNPAEATVESLIDTFIAAINAEVR